jgi:hypothetical protein
MALGPPALPLNKHGHPVAPGSLIDDLTLHWPWPYDQPTLAAIGAMLPPDQSARTVRAIVKIARMSALGRFALGPSPSKPNVRAETEAFKRAVIQAREAAEALSPDALELLSKRNSIEDMGEHFHRRFAELLTSLYRFESYDLAPEEASTPGAGTIEKPVGWVLHQFDLVFTQAHGGDRPSKGFPAFVEACVGPLGFEHVSAGARRDQLSNWRARRNWPEFG